MPAAVGATGVMVGATVDAGEEPPSLGRSQGRSVQACFNAEYMATQPPSKNRNRVSTIDLLSGIVVDDEADSGG